MPDAAQLTVIVVDPVPTRVTVTTRGEPLDATDTVAMFVLLDVAVGALPD